MRKARARRQVVDDTPVGARGQAVATAVVRSERSRQLDAAVSGVSRLAELAGVAQLVEQLIRNQQVVRSTRIAGSKITNKDGDVLALVKVPC